MKLHCKLLDPQTNSLGTSTFCLGGSSCCTKENPCSLGEGDCDNNEDCKGGLICGHNNCPMKLYGTYEWDQFDDCCTLGNNFLCIISVIKYILIQVCIFLSHFVNSIL